MCKNCPDKGRRWVAMPGDYGAVVHFGRKCRNGHLRWCMVATDNSVSSVYNDAFVHDISLHECIERHAWRMEVTNECPYYAEFFLNECCEDKDEKRR